MSPRPGFVLCLSAAALIHAVVLLVPRPAGREAAVIPSMEVTLAAGRAEAAGDRGQSAAPTTPRPRVTASQASPGAARSAVADAVGVQVPAALAAQVPTPLAEPTGQAVTAPAAAPASTDTEASGPSQPVESTGAGPGAPSADSASPAGGGGTGSGAGVGGSAGAVGASGFSVPRPLTDIRPVYPRAARRAGWQGVVRVRALVGINGDVASAEVDASSGHPILDEAALDAVRITVFAPAQEAGKAVASLVIIPVRFQLN